MQLTQSTDPFLARPVTTAAAEEKPTADASTDQTEKSISEIEKVPSLLVEMADSAVISASDLPPGVVKLTDYETPEVSTASQTVPDRAIQFAAAERRIVLPASHESGELFNPEANENKYPDEYIFDGGDRGFPIHYDSLYRQGLETEDTIAEYRDNHGQPQVEQSNRVAIYAPRFAEVKTVTQSESGYNIDHLAASEELVYHSGMKGRTGSVNHAQRLQVENMRMRSRASGIEHETGQAGVGQTTRIAGHTKLQNAFQDLGLVRNGRMDQSDAARISEGMHAADTWSHKEYPVIAGTTAAAEEVYTRTKTDVMIAVKEDPAHDSRLRIVKLADKEEAHQGETITFTIRYDNLGTEEAHGVRILDNLTPRLQFVEGSASSDRAGELNVTDNQEGSQLLKFELDEPLPGKTGGVITFQVIVK